jgi:hypothetical protein
MDDNNNNFKKKKKVIDIDKIITGKFFEWIAKYIEEHGTDIKIVEVFEAIQPIVEERFIPKLQEVLGGGADNYELAHLDFGESFPLGEGYNTNIWWCGAYSENRENEGIVLSTCDPDSEILDIPQFQLLIAPYGIFKRKTANGTWSEWETLGSSETATSAEMVTIWNETNNN